MKVQDFLNTIFQKATENQPESDNNLQIATAVLFIELADADFKISNVEKTYVKDSLQKFFDLKEDEVNDLITVAKRYRDERNDIWFFTRQINENFNREKKIDILELLWKLVYADGKKDKFEEALMRKLTTLLGLSHGDMIETKLKAQN